MLISLILDLVNVTLTNGGGPSCTMTKRQCNRCDGRNIKVKINGYKSGSQVVKVSCSVEEKPVVERGKTVSWNENNGLGNCKSTNFDTSQRFLPKVQLITSSSRAYCPRVVKLEIITINDLLPVKHTYCASMNGFYNINDKRNHQTSENLCE